MSSQIDWVFLLSFALVTWNIIATFGWAASASHAKFIDRQLQDAIAEIARREKAQLRDDADWWKGA